MLERIHTAFLESVGEPEQQFSFSDAPVDGFVSSVARVLKRYPKLERFASTAPVLPGSPPVRQISNGSGSAGAGESIDFATLLAVASGVPRSFPFHNLTIRFHSPAFGEPLPGSPAGVVTPGVTIGDSWWVNGRNRSLTAFTIVDADPAAKDLPPPSGAAATVIAACGKVKSTVQVPLSGMAQPDAAKEAGAIVQDYRTRYAEILERADLPHDLPPAADARKATGLGEATGPKKPVLDRAFKPMGYKCRGGSGTFTLSRKTKGNLTVQVDLDVGTWSRSLTASFRVTGLGCSVRLPLPVSRRAMAFGQYPIGGADHWQQLVDNMAALVAELDRSFVPEVEAVTGPSPAWYTPES
jgi:hypothetical protein